MLNEKIKWLKTLGFINSNISRFDMRYNMKYVLLNKIKIRGVAQIKKVFKYVNE